MKPVIQVVCALIWQNNKILIARKKREKSLGGFWEFPGGKVKDNEDQRVALQREILEELGVTISSLRFFGEGFYKNDELSINLIAYQCTPSSYDFTLIDHDTFAFVEPKDLVDFKIAPADMFIAESLWEYQTE